MFVCVGAESKDIKFYESPQGEGTVREDIPRNLRTVRSLENGIQYRVRKTSTKRLSIRVLHVLW